MSLEVRNGVVDPECWYLVEKTPTGTRWLMGPWAERDEAVRAKRLTTAERRRQREAMQAELAAFGPRSGGQRMLAAGRL